MVLAVFLSIYIGSLLGIALATVLLILFGASWGKLPRFYLKAVDLLQSLYSISDEPDPNHSAKIIEKSEESTIENHRNDSFASFNFSIPKKNTPLPIFELCSDACKAGIEAIIQDELTCIFETAPTPRRTLLEFPHPKKIFNTHSFLPISISCHAFSITFRYFFLLPIRLILLISSFLYATVAVITSFFVNLSNQQRIQISIVYCRLFCASIGAVITYHDLKNRPKRPGLAVANHMTPNDIQIIYADMDSNCDDGYTITGQRHNGMIGVIQTLVEKICPSLWLNRQNENDRKQFTTNVFSEVMKSHPVLVFPEGYCSNNTKVMRFRKAIFDGGITVYPIALKQNPRYGDSFWYEDRFWKYMLRQLTSWAIVYDVYYLKGTQRHIAETNERFAKRIQDSIAEKIQVQSLPLDGALYYYKGTRERLKEVQQRNFACSITEKYETLMHENSMKADRTIELIKALTDKTKESAIFKTLSVPSGINFINAIPVST